MDPELISQVLNILIPALATLLAAWFGVLGAKIKASYEEKINTEVKRNVVRTTVEYVQQVFKEIDGNQKLQKAVEQASLILVEKGIPVSETELNTLIESAVYGLKNGLQGDKEA